LVDAGCSRLAVARISEAIELRAAGITPEKANIIIMTAPLPEEIDVALGLDVSVFIPDLERLEYLKRVSARRKRPARFHVKVDTGLGRIGFMPKDAPVVARAIRNLGNCRLEGIGTHLSAAREDTEQNLRQLERFEEFVACVDPPPDCLIHMANSVAILRFPRMIKSAVRIGYLIYGLNLVPNPPIVVKPVLSFTTRVIQVKELPRGWHVGYGTNQWVTEPMRTATVPVGTGDGLLTPQINRAYLLVNGKRCRLLGTCSDMSMIDITVAGPVKVGDEVVYIGRQGDEEVTAIEQRTAAGVGVAELLTSTRVPRIYLKDAKTVGLMHRDHAEGIAKV
jgi:alanine racemase